MLREIKEITKMNKDYHEASEHVVTLEGVLKNNIVIRFISTNRNDTSYVIDYKSETRDLFYSGTYTYTAMYNMYKKVIKDVEELLSYLEIEISSENRNKISKIICDCIGKCKSRYGNAVKDYDKYAADAVLIIEGEDNGKEKHIVKFYDELCENLLIEDYPITYGTGKVSKENNYIKWSIDKDSCSLNDLITELISEFENPYLIISPELEVILDFRFKSEKYENS